MMQESRVKETWQDGARYPFAEIEPKWQEHWLEEGTFRTVDEIDERPKYYVLVMFPYPSGTGLHVGHPESYTAADIMARYKRMRGFRVLHPMGWDAFGLPAEQYAVETGVHPRLTTERNIENMRRQLKAFGLSYDWSREIKTIDPDYYKWTQWIFRELRESYFDQATNKARPIAELTDQLEAGTLRVAYDDTLVTRDEGRAWSDLTVAEQERVLDSQRLAYAAEVPVKYISGMANSARSGHQSSITI